MSYKCYPIDDGCMGNVDDNYMLFAIESDYEEYIAEDEEETNYN